MKGVLISYSPWKEYMGFAIGDDGTEYAFFQELNMGKKTLDQIERLAILEFDLEKGCGTLNGCKYINNIKIVGYRHNLLENK